jgi:hypothetical protein
MLRTIRVVGPAAALGMSWLCGRDDTGVSAAGDNPDAPRSRDAGKAGSGRVGTDPAAQETPRGEAVNP